MKKIFCYLSMSLTFMFAFILFTGCTMDHEQEPNIPQKEITYTAPIQSSPPSEVDYSNYTTYYFDGDSGNDSNSGRSPIAAKRTVESIIGIARMASANNPIRILLKRGSKFPGELTLSGYAASADQPLVLDAYGDEEDGMPILSGLGADTDTAYPVVLITEGNTRLYNIEITDPYAYQGIFVNTVRAGAMENIVIEHCYVHDINFFWDDRFDPNNPPTDPDELDSICPESDSTGTKYGRAYYRNYGGIVFYNNTPLSVGASWYENVYVRYCTVERVARSGIYMGMRWNNAPGIGYGNNKYVEGSDRDDSYNNVQEGIGYFMHKNVNFIGNHLNIIAGDGIMLAGKDSFLEGNVCYRANYLGRLGRPIGTNAAYQYFNAGIWVNDSYNVVFQNNEAAYTFLRNGAGDGEGFDIDISCRNIYFQNNYAHHNEGGGLLLCNNSASLYRYDAEGNIISPQGQMETLTGDWGDNYVRNNVFAYNGTTADSSRSAFLTICRQVDDLYCYNNTVILGSIENQAIINIEDTRASKGHYYANNIFYSEQPTVARMNIALLNEPVFKNNLYFNLTGAYENTGEVENGTAILDVDPQIELPSDYDGINKMTYFAGNNPLLYTLGILIDGSLEFDPCGASAKGVAYIGAFAQKGRENEIL